MSKRGYRQRGPSQRQLRVGELVRRKLAQILSDWIPQEDNSHSAPITVGEVRMSPDLRKATVYVLPLGGQNTDIVLKALNEHRRDIRRKLNRTLYLKFSPALEFVADPAFDQMDETRRLLSLEPVRRDLSVARLREDTPV